MITIFPQPAKLKKSSGTFRWNTDRRVTFDPALASVKPFFFELLKTNITEEEKGDILFQLDEKLDEEAYNLSITKNCIRITCAGHVGALYGIQTLRQLGKFDLAVPASLPCVEISDAPRFGWRGLSLDESRHFFGKVEVKRLLDLMAMHKLNVFHWHLTDDQGWRIEIKKYPLLTELGAKRVGTQSKGWGSTYIDDIPVSGFYTQDEIKDIVQYAQQRGIMIVPEIDMPAHFAAALAGYNWLACREIPCEVFHFYSGIVPEKILGKKDWNRPACLGKETTYQFIYDVIDEVTALFPAPYFHIGGDECPKEEWKNCPHCAAMMKKQNLDSVEDLQGYFNNQIKRYLEQKNIRLIGWNEILAANNLDPSIIVQYWVYNRDKRAEAHVNNGGQMVMSKHQAFYFDMTYAQNPLKTTYKFQPALGDIKPENVKNILGVEGEVWSEFISDRAKLDLCIFPRMEALCEVAWSLKEKRSWRLFLKRLDRFMPILDALGIGYAKKGIFIPRWYRTKKILQLFDNGDPYYEVKQNQALKRKK